MGRKKNKPYLVEEVLVVDTEKGGKGIGKKDGKVFFVEKTVPGDLVDVWVNSKVKRIPQGRVERWIKRSEDRVEPVCDHFGTCGGCKWQSLSYEKQLFFKEKAVTDAFTRIGHLEIENMHHILGCELPLNYRNKVEFTFSTKRWVPTEMIESGDEIDWEGALGYHVARFFDKVVDVDTCYLHWPIINEIRNEIRRFAKTNDYTYYDIRGNVGFLRNIVFRTSEGSRELMLLLIVGEEDQEKVVALFEHLESKFAEITSFLSLFNPKKNSSFSDLKPVAWKGPEEITEHLGPWKYRISATSFFQTNTHQAKLLYDQVRRFLGEEKVGTIYDLYCGAGSIGIYVNDLADKVVGIEYVESSIKDAWKNCELNEVDHFSFHAGDMKKLLTQELVAKEGAPDVVITDPPRAGMDEAVVRQLLEIAAPRIIYVSCNPATQARDVALLSEMYDVVDVQPVDMFPQTTHVENVAYLVKKEIN